MRKNIPIGLRQILEVYRLIRLSGYKRQDAVRKVAQDHRVAVPTISSALTRGIGITASEADGYMLRGQEVAFCDHLIKHFPAHQEDIEDFFHPFCETNNSDASLKFSPYFTDEIKNELNVRLLDEVKTVLSRWGARDDIPEDLKTEILSLRNKL